MTSRLADQFAEINKRAEEIKAELHANIMGKPLEDAQPTEWPADIDWIGMYGSPCVFNLPDVRGRVRFALWTPSAATVAALQECDRGEGETFNGPFKDFIG